MSASQNLRQYYVAVGAPEQKAQTLEDLLSTMYKARPLHNFTAVICCSDRSSMDAVAYSLQQAQLFTVACLHSDLGENDCALVVKAFGEYVGVCEQMTSGIDNQERQRINKEIPVKPPLLVTTDVALRNIDKDDLPLNSSLLISYDLPQKKDVYQKRVSSVFGGSKERTDKSSLSIVVFFVVAGEMEAFRNLEAMSSVCIQEMHVQPADIFNE